MIDHWSTHSREELTMPHRLRWFALVCSLACSAGLAGCKPKAGDKCQGSSAACADTTAALVCKNDVLTTMPCRGAKGCTSSSSAVDCDNSLASSGDTCLEQGDVVCALDHATALTCEDGKFRLA